jgi:ABC-type uncharacterized transport system substrate-binding protein
VRRRDLARLSLGAVALSLARPRLAKAQESHPRRVGILASAPLHPIGSFKDRLQQDGWTEGRGIRFDERWGQGDDRSYPRLAAELAALPVDVMVTWGTPALLAAKEASRSIPIVMAGIGDPLAVGAVANLAHPGGNITGFSTQNYELEAKRFELLRELAPDATRIVALGNVGNPYSTAAMRLVGGLATTRRVQLTVVEGDAAHGIDDVLARLRAARPDAVQMLSIPAFFPYRRQIVELMATMRVPAIYPFPEFCDAGGLVCYATNFDDLFRQAADYVDKILRGAVPGELPVQQAATFRFIVNLKTAHTIALTVPPAILARADEVIE